MSKINVAILGSCVSRDIFRVADTNEIVEIKPYLARFPIFSFDSSTPLSRKLNWEEVYIPDGWEKTCLKHNFEKDFFALINQHQPDWLIIDLIDERFDLLQFGDDCFIPHLEGMKAQKYDIKPYLKANEIFTYRGSDTFTSGQLVAACEKFCQLLLKAFPESNIIVNETYMVNQYQSVQGEIKSFTQEALSKKYTWDMENINPKLALMYRAIRMKLPKAHFLSMPENTLAREDHKWNLAPMHFTDDYYIAQFIQLKKIWGISENTNAKTKENAENLSASELKQENIITTFMRKIRGGIRCLKEHGVKYTLRRVKEKIFRK